MWLCATLSFGDLGCKMIRALLGQKNRAFCGRIIYVPAISFRVQLREARSDTSAAATTICRLSEDYISLAQLVKSVKWVQVHLVSCFAKHNLLECMLSFSACFPKMSTTKQVIKSDRKQNLVSTEWREHRCLFKWKAPWYIDPFSTFDSQLRAHLVRWKWGGMMTSRTGWEREREKMHISRLISAVLNAHIPFLDVEWLDHCVNYLISHKW